MNSILSILSILIYTVYSQKCTNTHSQSTLLQISITRATTKLGVNKYLTTVNAAVDVILPTTNPRVAVYTVGGLTNNNQPVNPAYVQKAALAQTDYTTVSGIISGLSSEDYLANWGNMISSAMDNAVLVLGTASSAVGQRYNVIFTAGNPLASGFFDTTKPSNPNDPCPSAITAKKQNVQTYVVLIGTEGVNFVKEFYSCLVEDPSTDLIIIDPDNTAAGLALLDQRLCKNKPNGYDVKITEVNTVGGSGGYKPFIEILNRGAPATVAACWGSGGCSGTRSINAGQYFIAYEDGGTGTNPTGAAQTRNNLPDCNGCSATSWAAYVAIGGSEFTGTRVVYGGTGASGTSYWQVPLSGRSLELRGAGYNNQYGGNWRAACDPNVRGSPGQAAATCVATDNSCTDANCDLNGDNVGCSPPAGQQYCACTSNFLGDANACITMPKPPTTCYAYLIPDEVDKADWLYYAWNRVDWDDTVQYTVKYKDANNADKTSPSSGSAARAVNSWPAAGVSTIDVTAQYTSPLRSSSPAVTTTLTCQKIQTQAPTGPPTTQPTLSPNNDPTSAPTKAPTFDSPGAFIGGGVCGPDRCECFEEPRGCCNPFDASLPTKTTGFVPRGGCNNAFKSIQVPVGREEDYQEEIKMLLYPAGYIKAATVRYSITAYGVINLTDFQNITEWTGDRRRRIIGRKGRTMNFDDIAADIDIVGRKLLQSNTTTTTTTAPVSPTSTNLGGNELNIEVSPPGTSDRYDGVLTMTAGKGSIFINVTTATLKCEVGQDCVTVDECTSQALGFGLVITSCDITETGNTDTCEPMYPYILWLSVTRSTELCEIVFGLGSKEDELPDWFWWVLIALIIFLLILAWLVYRFWWKQKKTASELGDAEDELDQQQADNEAGFGKDLDVGDVAFNPMATGVPGMNRPADAFGNELHQRQLEQQNDMVDVQAEIFQVRQDYGQVATGDRHHQGGYGQQQQGGYGQGGY